MATKFYLSSTANSSGLTPTVHTNWDGGQAPTNFIRYDLMTTINESAMTNVSTTVAAIVEECQIQFISKPLAAQTYAIGTVSGGIMQIVATTGATFFAYNIWVCDSTGAVRGVIVDASANISNAINSTANYTHEYDSAEATASVVITKGDRLIIEVGYDVNNSTSKTMGCKAGSLAANGDIASDSTSTTIVNGQFTFSVDIPMAGGGLMMVGCGS